LYGDFSAIDEPHEDIGRGFVSDPVKKVKSQIKEKEHF
jgi:hypothetical protein